MTRVLGIRVGAAMAAIAVLSAACGGGGGGGGGGGDEATGRATAVAGVPDGAAFVDQDGLKFQPGSLTASANEVVFFKNSESTVHTVTINGTNESGTMSRDEVFEWAPPAPGVYKVTCDFHPQMKATLTVE